MVFRVDPDKLYSNKNIPFDVISDSKKGRNHESYINNDPHE